MEFLTYVTKCTNRRLYKKLLIFSGFILLAFMATSWISEKHPHRNHNVWKGTALGNRYSANITEKLYLLSLTNEELNGLLTTADSKVVVFQFLHDKTNSLTLNAWPRHKDGSYKPEEVKTLIYKESNVVVNTIRQNEIHLGDLYIDTNETNEYAKLCEAVKDTANNKFFLFVPDSRGTHIFYNIYASPSLPKNHGELSSITNPPKPHGKALSAMTAKSLTGIIAHTNPSPPYKSY